MIDINLVPREWTKVIIEIDDKKIREALKLYGTNLNIPGIIVKEKKIPRSTRHFNTNKKEEREVSMEKGGQE